LTDRLYYHDSYLREFEATILERLDNGRRVYLDQTAFYPTSGGQPFDTGELGGVPVLDVIDEESRIAHLLASAVAGDRVAGRIDWQRRFDHMQQHTGQHVLSAVAAELLGCDTVSVHFGREVSTIDLHGPPITTEQVTALERDANQIVFENRPVQVSFEEASEAIGLRKRPARTGTIRIITIQQLDRSACGGTHVRATGEIGPIFIRKIERARGAMRVEFVCGGRAVARARSEYDLLSDLSSAFSAAPHELPELFASQRAELKEAYSAKRDLEREVSRYRARELYQSASPDAGGMRRVIVREGAGSLDEIRRIAQEFATLPLAMFVGVVPAPPGIVLAASPDSGINAANVLKGLLSAVNGRGGGSATLAQGVVPGVSELEQVLAAVGAAQSKA
jgi:alanyl-tRNA synthetase